MVKTKMRNFVSFSVLVFFSVLFFFFSVLFFFFSVLFFFFSVLFFFFFFSWRRRHIAGYSQESSNSTKLPVKYEIVPIPSGLTSFLKQCIPCPSATQPRLLEVGFLLGTSHVRSTGGVIQTVSSEVPARSLQRFQHLLFLSPAKLDRSSGFIKPKRIEMRAYPSETEVSAKCGGGVSKMGC